MLNPLDLSMGFPDPCIGKLESLSLFSASSACSQEGNVPTARLCCSNSIFLSVQVQIRLDKCRLAFMCLLYKGQIDLKL